MADSMKYPTRISTDTRYRTRKSKNSSDNRTKRLGRDQDRAPTQDLLDRLPQA